MISNILDPHSLDQNWAVFFSQRGFGSEVSVIPFRGAAVLFGEGELGVISNRRDVWQLAEELVNNAPVTGLEGRSSPCGRRTPFAARFRRVEEELEAGRAE